MVDVSMRLVVFVAAALALTGCSTDDDIASISHVVERSDFVIRIPGTGELEAKVSTPISLPARMFQWQTIAWLAEENSYVEKGQVVARIDSRFYETSLEQERLRIAQEDIKYESKERNLDVEEREIDVEADLLVEEEVLADRFSLQDLTFISRKEIVDNMRDRELIGARRFFNDWRDGVHTEKSANELGLLMLEREQIETRQSQYRQVVEAAEVKAPHDGLLVVAMNRQKRQKYRPGDALFPGSSFASIPDLTELQARIFVLETESSGLKLNQRVEIVLRAFPDTIIKGEVVQVGAVSKPREEGNPLKFFESVVRLESTKLDKWRPGLQLDVTVFAHELQDVLTVPSQAFFRRNDSSFVFVHEDGDWVPRKVELGVRSLAQTEVKAGLEVGDRVALYLPADVDDIAKASALWQTQ